MSQSSHLIKNAAIVTMDESLGVLRGADLLIEGDTITKITYGLTSDTAEIIDGSSAIVCPGFIDTHRHTWQTQLRTICTDFSLSDYFAQIRNIYGACYTAEDVYWGNYVGELESLNAGITYIVDHSHLNITPLHADGAVTGLLDTGIRATYCYGTVMGPHHPDLEADIPSGDWHPQNAQRIRERYFATPGLVRFGFAPKEFERMDLADLAKEIQMGRDMGAELITGHIAIGPPEYSKHLVKQLDTAGILRPDILLSHGTALSDDELSILRTNKIGISSTPEAELQMGMGLPIAFHAKDKGAIASLGIDVTSNSSTEIFSQMRLLLQAQRHADRKMGQLKKKRKTADVVRMATIGGAEAVHQEKFIGSLAEGKKADLIMISTDEIGMWPWQDPYGLIVQYANPSLVDTVFVDGKLAKRNGKLVNVDWGNVKMNLARSTKGIFERASNFGSSK